MRDYHDTEWGVPVSDERGLFERLSLEGFQAGLSWSTILNKRDRFREVFHGFEVDRVAAMTDDDLEKLMSETGIVRNRAKILVTRRNARATVDLRDGGGLVARRQPAMRIDIDERDAGRRRGAIRERLLAYRRKRVVLRQLETRY